jgi:transcriptional regulator with XRE-family HTH domain
MTHGLGTDTDRQAALVARLRWLRAATRLGVDELADAAGIHRTTYREVEAGRAAPGTLTYLDLLALAEALDVPPAAILTDLRTPPGALPEPPRPGAGPLN